MDAATIAAEFAERHRSALWEITDPDTVAAWVLGDDDEPAALSSLADGAEDVAAAFRRQAGLNAVRATALGIIGSFSRTMIPEAGATAGTNWIVSSQGRDDRPLVRLSVGVPEVACAEWRDGRLGLFLRIAASPIDEGLASGELSAARMSELGIERLEDPYVPQAHDAAAYWCLDTAAATWFCDQGPVRRAARLMCTRLVLMGKSLHARNYKGTVAAESWAASEPASARGGPRGFTRPYRGRPRPIDYKPFVNTGGEAREAAIAEHHALCVRLIAHLAGRGIDAGELDEPPVDLAWRGERGTQMIAEIKSCLWLDATAQLRLGLGQVLEYRQRMAPGARAVLLVSRVPDPVWDEVCGSVDVCLLSGADEAAWAARLSHG